MNIQTHEELKAKIWEIANRLRGPYRPPQYRLVMLPMVVLRRLDCVLEPTKDAVLKKLEELEAQQMPEAALDRLLGKTADPKRKHALYNTSPYTFARLLGDAENIAPNLVSYINGFSPTARRIFERFKFADQVEKLDASNRLFTIVKAMTDVDLHPDRIDNLQMGYLFEHLVMRFNEQANEEAGDHFTPREVIRLMANLIYTGEQDQELVADELATQVDEDRRSAGQARAVLLAAAGRRAFEPQAVRRHAAQDLGAAAAKRVALTGRGATVFGSQRFRKEQCRPERRSARSSNVCERMDEPWRLPAEVMYRVQREKTWYSGPRGCILSPCQGQNGNPGCNSVF